MGGECAQERRIQLRKVMHDNYIPHPGKISRSYKRPGKRIAAAFHLIGGELRLFNRELCRLATVQQIADARTIASAHGKLLAIYKMHHEISPGFAAHFLYIAEIYDSRAVNTQK